MTAPKLVLYHLGWCVFCIRVRQVASTLGIPLDLIDVGHEPQHRDRLYAGTGCSTVPVLGILSNGSEELLAESSPIVAYLKSNAEALTAP